MSLISKAMAGYLSKELVSPLGTLVPVALNQDQTIIPVNIAKSELGVTFQLDGVIWDREPLIRFSQRLLQLGLGLKHTLEESPNYPFIHIERQISLNNRPDLVSKWVPGIQILSFPILYPDKREDNSLNLFAFYREGSIPAYEYDGWVKKTLENANKIQQGTNWDQFPRDLRTVHAELYLIDPSL